MKPKQISFKTHIGFEIIRPDQIIYCKANGSYTNIITVDKTVTISKNLKEIEAICGNPDIVKCHKSYIVNLNYVDRICNDCSILMKNNEVIPISRNKVVEVLKLVLKNIN